MSSYSDLSDRELTILLAKSDTDAFETIYNRYKIMLHGHAYKKCADREEAKDIVQDVFAALWKNRDHRFPDNLGAYLYTAVRNSVINHITRNGVKNKYIDSFQQFAQHGEVIADHLIREKQLAAQIENEVNALPERMKLIFEMSRKEHLSHKQIAERLGIAESTVDRQISNALKILKSNLNTLPFLVILASFQKFN